MRFTLFSFISLFSLFFSLSPEIAIVRYLCRCERKRPWTCLLQERRCAYNASFVVEDLFCFVISVFVFSVDIYVRFIYFPIILKKMNTFLFKEVTNDVNESVIGRVKIPDFVGWASHRGLPFRPSRGDSRKSFQLSRALGKVILETDLHFYFFRLMIPLKILDKSLKILSKCS